MELVSQSVSQSVLPGVYENIMSELFDS